MLLKLKELNRNVDLRICFYYVVYGMFLHRKVGEVINTAKEDKRQGYFSGISNKSSSHGITYQTIN
jgi:hypothetical protein